MRRLPSLSIIFEKDDTGCYTRSALLYQDILRYSLNIEKAESSESKSFRHWDLAKWLVSNNQEFVNRYRDPSNRHTNISNRIENTRQRTKSALSDLKDLRLIRLIGAEPQRKGTGTVHLYKFRRPAFLLAWLMEGTKPVKRNRANDEIFKLLDSYFNGPFAPPMEIYQLNLYSKFRSKGVFGELVVDNIREMCEISNATDIDQFLNEYSSILKASDDEKRKIFLESWKQTMDELDLRTKELVMNGFKLDIEGKMRKKVPDLKTFDNMRFDLRGKYDKVIVTGRCVNCRRILIGEIDILEFIESYNSTRDHNLYTNCKVCQTGKMIIDKI